MVIHMPDWSRHPHVRSGKDLTRGERAADKLKQGFGSWTFLGTLNAFILIWVILNMTGVFHFDLYPFILLNLGLSWLAAQQGGALQIASNRGDRISAELAMSTHTNTQALMDMNRLQLEILKRLEAIENSMDNPGDGSV